MQSIYFPPGNFDLLLVSGPDAVRFLQGQLTCDVQGLADGASTPGAACNNKGRVHATFTLIRSGSSFFIVLNRGLGALLLGALGKFLPFYKCTMTDAGNDWHCVGLAGADVATLLLQSGIAVPQDSNCQMLEPGWVCRYGATADQYLVCAPPDASLLQALATKLMHGSVSHWQGLAMQDGHFPFAGDDAEQYTPQELHLDRHGYISFSKGCYTGQEIVARLHYRSKPKKELYLVQASGQDAPGLAGLTELPTADGGSARIIKQATLPDGSIRFLVQLPAGLSGQIIEPTFGNCSGLTLHSF